MWPDKESDVDYLNFGEVSRLAVDILTDPRMLPASIGIFGNWGAGKSTLLRLIEGEVRKEQADHVSVRFDAWLYQGYDDARAALLEVIATELKSAARGNESLLDKATQLLSRVNKFRTMALLAEGAATYALGIPTGGLLTKVVDFVGQLKEIGNEPGTDLSDQEEPNTLTNEIKRGSSNLSRNPPEDTPPRQIAAFREEYTEILTELGRPLIVIIDNLDRCLPANAIYTLEAIRLFLFLPNTAFIIAADEEMIRNAVAEHFKNSSERHQIDYLDKLIQIPIRVPKAGVREIRSYLFMLFALEHGVDGDKLERLRIAFEQSLQSSWKEEGEVDKVRALQIVKASADDNVTDAFGLADRIAPILATSSSIHGNPRIVKRLLNVIKMRSRIAQHRRIPLDEGIITKLVIFERCAGADATIDLYRCIDSEAGKPGVFKELESSDRKPAESKFPKSWTKSPSTTDFILEWGRLEPSLQGVDLRPAIYLSRETLPIGVYTEGLSPAGREVLQTLASVKNISSVAAKEALITLPADEALGVMERLIDQLRRVSNWKHRPLGFAGAYLLADRSPESAAVFSRFISNLEQHKWMKAVLKNANWHKEV